MLRDGTKQLADLPAEGFCLCLGILETYQIDWPGATGTL